MSVQSHQSGSPGGENAPPPGSKLVYPAIILALFLAAGALLAACQTGDGNSIDVGPIDIDLELVVMEPLEEPVDGNN